jgi:hypothetical protein
MTEQARRDYTLSYSPAGNNHSKELHTLRVTATPGYSATTRWGYRTTVRMHRVCRPTVALDSWSDYGTCGQESLQ